MAPRIPIPLREIVYTLSPYQHEVLKQGIEKLPAKAFKFVKRVGPGAVGGGRDGLAAAARCGAAARRAAPQRARQAVALQAPLPLGPSSHRSFTRPFQSYPQNAAGYAIMGSILFLPIW